MDAISTTGVVSDWLTKFQAAVENRDVDKLKKLFAEECFWRDLVAFTWNLKTLEGKNDIGQMAAEVLPEINAQNFQIDGEASESDGIVDAWFTFETDACRGRGHVRLKDGECWTLLTTAQELKGHEEKRGPTRETGVDHGVLKERKTWAEKREQERKELGYERQPYVVIVGGGQGGIALGARLKRLNVPTIIIEKNDRPGDSWRNRYKS